MTSAKFQVIIKDIDEKMLGPILGALPNGIQPEIMRMKGRPMQILPKWRLPPSHCLHQKHTTLHTGSRKCHPSLHPMISFHLSNSMALPPAASHIFSEKPWIKG